MNLKNEIIFEIHERVWDLVEKKCNQLKFSVQAGPLQGRSYSWVLWSIISLLQVPLLGDTVLEERGPRMAKEGDAGQYTIAVCLWNHPTAGAEISLFVVSCMKLTHDKRFNKAI